MPNLKYSSLITLIGLSHTLLGCGESDQPPHEDIGLDAQGVQEVETLADQAVAAGLPGVSVAIVRDDQTITITRGVSDRETGAAVSPEHRFRMASVAKSLVASVVLQLVDEGRLKLDDTLEQWLPGELPTSGNVTIQQLVRQESGIFDFAADERWMAPLLEGDLEHHWQPTELVALAADHPPDFAPGERWAYSNTNYLLLAMIVEKISGDSLENVVKSRITEPLALGSTTMETDSDMNTPFMHGYLVGQGDPIDVTRISGSAVFGHGNLVSTPLELAHFYRALVRGDVVSKRQLPQMLALDPNVPSHYGMGLFRLSEFYPCGTFVGHDGQTPGYDSVAYTSLDGRREFVVSVSSSTMEDKAGDEAAQEAFHALIFASACR
jgi:D-alanyl-D-alanine carboxypeptidase